MENKIIGKYSGKPYLASEAIRIIGAKQAALYWLNGLEPLDIFPSRNYETNEPAIVYVFKKEDTKDLFDLWCKHELK